MALRPHTITKTFQTIFGYEPEPVLAEADLGNRWLMRSLARLPALVDAWESDVSVLAKDEPPTDSSQILIAHNCRDSLAADLG